MTERAPPVTLFIAQKPDTRYYLQMTEPFQFTQGNAPLLVSMPHASARIPEELQPDMTEIALLSNDRDRDVDKLYDFAGDLGASTLAATYSRYVIDLNRDPAGIALYDDRQNTELCPVTSFDNEPLYNSGKEPSPEQIAARLEKWWQPYHRKLREELDRMKETHGIAVLFEAHTIRSNVARFHDGEIPDLNLGTANGQSADDGLLDAATAALGDSGYSIAINNIFSGGYITRHFGAPGQNIHALQLELTWKNYLDEETGIYAPERADKLKKTLRRLLEALLDWAEHHRPA